MSWLFTSGGQSIRASASASVVPQMVGVRDGVKHSFHFSLRLLNHYPNTLRISLLQFSSVQLLSCVQLFVTPGTAVCQASLSITNSRRLLKLMSIIVGDAIQPSHPLPFPSPPAFSPSQHQGLFQQVGSSHQVAKVWEFQLQHQSFQ